MTHRADGDRVAHPLFQEGGGGSTPTSALQLEVSLISVRVACELNRKWHSRLPVIEPSNVYRNKHHFCFCADHEGVIYAVAVWTSPVARMLNDGETIELRRFAISQDAPKNTGSRVLSVMCRLMRKSHPELSRAVSYQDVDVHNGTIYSAAGWVRAAVSKGRQWSCRSRARRDVQSSSDKIRWEKRLNQKPT